MNKQTRAWIYRVVLAAMPILTAYGVVSENDAPLFVALAAAVLSAGLATVNTSTKA